MFELLYIFENWSVFPTLCDYAILRQEVNCAKSHQRTISEAMILILKKNNKERSRCQKWSKIACFSSVDCVSHKTKLIKVACQQNICWLRSHGQRTCHGKLVKENPLTHSHGQVKLVKAKLAKKTCWVVHTNKLTCSKTCQIKIARVNQA